MSLRKALPALVAVLAATLLVGACNPGPVPTVTASPSPSAPGLDRPEPGKDQVSTTKLDQAFFTTVNFKYFGGQCDKELCSAGVYPSANPKDGTPSMVIDGYPIEKTDKLQVLCQVMDGKSVRNNREDVSQVWDLIVLPTNKMTPAARKHYTGSTGYTPDMWLQNSGFHAKSCPNRQLPERAAA